MEQAGYSTKAKLLLALAAVGAIILIGFGFASLGHSGKGELDLHVAPAGANIMLNDVRIGEHAFVEPGNYRLVVSENGFASYQKNVQVGTGSKQVLAIALVPQTVEAQAVVNQQVQRYREVEGIGGQVAQQSSETFTDDNPIVAHLPYKNSLYSIDYARGAGTKIIIQITASSPAGRQVALTQIKSWGFQPADYQVQFIGLSNPFGQSKQGGN